LNIKSIDRWILGQRDTGVSKKIGKPIKPRKLEKKLTEKTEPKKKTD